VLQDTGDLAGAKAAYERALATLRQFIAEDHPNVVQARKNLETVEAELRRRDLSS
jgi:ABC-type transporter Mla subunit MlaD